MTLLESRSYRRLSDTRGSTRLSWTLITRRGIRIAFQGTFIKLLCFSAVTTAAVVIITIYLIEQLVAAAGGESVVVAASRFLPLTLVGSSPASLDSLREPILRTLFATTMPHQLTWIAIMGFRLVPVLMSRDLEVRAHAIYFSRPVFPATYWLGKVLIPTLYFMIPTMLANWSA